MRVLIDGVVVADSHRPWLLFETGLPVRYYLPKVDVRMDLLEPTDSHTYCPYKGTASYWTAVDRRPAPRGRRVVVPVSAAREPARRRPRLLLRHRATVEVDGVPVR